MMIVVVLVDFCCCSVFIYFVRICDGESGERYYCFVDLGIIYIKL